MTGITEKELSVRLAALQSMCNLLDWEEQNGTRLGKSCGSVDMAEPLKTLRRELLITHRKHVGQRAGMYAAGQTESTLEQALTAELNREAEQEKRFTDEQAQERDRLTREAGKAWEACRESAEGEAPGNAESEKKYLDVLGQQTQLLQKVLKTAGYESCLRDYEECYSNQEIQDYFENCKKELKDLISKRLHEQQMEEPVWRPKEQYDPERQRQLAHFLSGYLGFDFSRGQLGETIHPFTTAVSRDYVCWSDRYVPDNPFAAIFTALHETGHALYEQNIAKELTGTVLAGGCSSAMHEAVARFYENCIGRREDFWEPIYGKVTEILGGEFEKLPLSEFMRRVRWIAPGPVRTEADELSYPFHIIMRYELEQALLTGDLSPEDLPVEWNKKIKEYLDVEPSGVKEGYLQDIHWSAGQFGYFPAYQTGNAIAAQIYHQVKSALPLSELLKAGRLEQLKEYLTTHIFRYGMTRNSEEILQSMTGEPLKFQYYLEYLKGRYGEKKVVL